MASFVEGWGWVISSGRVGAEGWTTSTAYATATNTTLTSLWHEIVAARGAGSYQDGACLRCFGGACTTRSRGRGLRAVLGNTGREYVIRRLHRSPLGLKLLCCGKVLEQFPAACRLEVARPRWPRLSRAASAVCVPYCARLARPILLYAIAFWCSRSESRAISPRDGRVHRAGV